MTVLPVKGRAARTGYSRALFGQAWADADRNGCGTRDDILRRDLDGLTLRAGTRGCVVVSGVLRDPYTGSVIRFTKAQATAVQIDHVVALSNAWQTGAQSWTPAKRLAFANDPLNLLAVDGPTNEAKSDGDAATWLPPVKGYRCAYVARQVAVKAHYGLWTTVAEKDAMRRVLTACPSQGLPKGGLPVPTGSLRPTAAPTRTTALSPEAGGAGLADPGNVKNCADFDSWEQANAWFQIYLPRFGDVARLDANGDGVPCESLLRAP